MPLIYVQRYAQQVVSDGVQTVDGVLAFTGPTVIELDPTVYNAPGKYVLFSYGSFPGGQAALTSYVTFDISSLVGRTVTDPNGTDEPSLNRVTVTLG